MNEQAPRARLASIPARAWVDVSVLTLLAAVGILGFAPSFADQQYLWAGVGGLLVGTAAGALAAILRFGPVLTLLVGVFLYFLLGTPLAMPEQALAVVLPSLESLSGLAIGAVFGWADIVTLSTPVAVPDYIGVLPYAAAWVVGIVSSTIACRWFARHRRTALASLIALLAPIALYLASVLTGTDEPYLATARGIGFAVIAIVWMAWRVPDRSASSSKMQAAILRQRLAGIALITATAVGGAIVLGGAAAPAAGSRFVLRDHIEPPFDPTVFPSPLTGFRSYLLEDRKDETMLEVSSSLAGSRLRIATMDAYDGRLWNVTGPELDADGSGTFHLVSGGQLTAPIFFTAGDTVSATVTVEGYEDVWIPAIGYPTRLEFSASEAPASTAVRYNDATGILVDVDRLDAGMSYQFDAVTQAGADVIPGIEQAAVANVNLPPATNVPDFIGAKATEWTAAADTPYEKLLALVEGFQTNGYFSHGRADEPDSPAGHGADRMNRLLDGKVAMVGDQEQYASAFALMARFLGYPSRVVMGFDLPSSGVVTGEDVTAWAEVAFDGIGWVAFDPVPDRTDVPVQQAPQSKSKPQPLVRQPPRDDGDQDELVTAVGIDDISDPPVFTIPRWVWIVIAALGIPLALYLIPLLVIAAIKRRRRRRRRTIGTDDRRAAGAWDELVDTYAELGYQAPRDATRVQLALLFEGQFRRELDARTKERDDAADRDRNRATRRAQAAELKAARTSGGRAPEARATNVGRFVEQTVLRARDASTWRPGVTDQSDPLPAIPGPRAFAVASDRAVFSGRDISEDDIDGLWAGADDASKAARDSVSWFRRRLSGFRVRARFDVATVAARLNALAPTIRNREAAPQ